jgi:hypothetical protein
LNVYPVDEERYQVSFLLRTLGVKSSSAVDPDLDQEGTKYGKKLINLKFSSAGCSPKCNYSFVFMLDLCLY